MARDSSGVSGGCRGEPRVVGLRDATRPDVGVVCRALASAATAPVRGSSTTTAPESAGHPRLRALAISVARAFSAAACTRTSSEVTRSRPGTGSVRETTPVTRPRASTATTVRPGTPRRTGVVLLLEAGPADEVVGHEAAVAAHLLGAHLAEVAQRLGRADAERAG